MDYNRKLPIGIQSFEDLRANNYLYVDKTEFMDFTKYFIQIIWDL